MKRNNLDPRVLDYTWKQNHLRKDKDSLKASMLEVIVGGAGCEEMEQAPRSAARGHGLEEFATGRYAAGVLSVSRTRLHWRLLDSVDGIELDAVTRAPRRR